METNGIDFNAGNPGGGSQGNPDSGNQGGNPSQNAGNPGNQGGQQTDPRDAELAKYKEEARRLNQALVEAKRNGNNSQRQQNPNTENFDANDPATQYGMAMKMATGDLRGKLEGILDLYPEIPADVQAEIRRNPWAYVNEDNYLQLNVANALLDIETILASKAEKLSQNQNGANQNGQGNQPSPASVNPNSAAEGGNSEADPMEDWSLPMDQLEAKVAKIKTQAQKSTK